MGESIWFGNQLPPMKGNPRDYSDNGNCIVISTLPHCAFTAMTFTNESLSILDVLELTPGSEILGNFNR
jgi:hypothetical protein